MLRAARLGCEIRPVTITGGERSHIHCYGWNVPKQDLISGVRVLLERGELRIARDLRGLRILMRELMEMHETGEHDDLVIALALACWRAKRK